MRQNGDVGVQNAKMLKIHWFYCYFWRCHGKPDPLNRPNGQLGKAVWEGVGGSHQYNTIGWGGDFRMKGAHGWPPVLKLIWGSWVHPTDPRTENMF